MKNKNSCMVNVRKDRHCSICGNIIHKGSKCYTINPKYQDRKYICMSCINDKDDEPDYYVDYTDYDDGYSSNML